MVRVALVGYGFMGRMHAAAYGAIEDAEVAVVVERSLERRERASEALGVPTVATWKEAVGIADFHVADVCLPTFLHAEATIEAAESGKHVVCEKPMALDLADADRMIAAAQRAGVGLMVAHCIRFWPEYAYLRDLVRDGALGRLTSLNLTRYGEFPTWSSENWLADPAKSGGGALDMHIHDTDFALALLGAPEDVAAWGTIDATGPCHVFSTLRYPGCVVHLEGGWNLPPGTPFCMSYRAVFERGAALFDRGELVVYGAEGDPLRPAFTNVPASVGGNIDDLAGYYHELRYFVDQVRSGGDFAAMTPESSRASLALTLEEIRQIRGKR